MPGDPAGAIRPGTERLTPDHDLSGFDCGTPSLNVWLVRFAWPNQQADAAKTYVACRGTRVVGYYSLVAASVQRNEANEAPHRIVKGLASHPVGTVLLARLAVDQGEKGQGLGKALLKDALSRVAQAAEIVGVRAALVHALDENAKRFYQHFDFEPSPVNPMHLMLLIKDLRALLR
jgi:GNAT superfamily N-acetyltransferase